MKNRAGLKSLKKVEIEEMEKWVFVGLVKRVETGRLSQQREPTFADMEDSGSALFLGLWKKMEVGEEEEEGI
jgi:hypothetical protein